MGKVRQFEIAYDQPAGVYSAGSELKGAVLLDLDKPMTIKSLRISLLGRGKVHWTKSDGETNTDYRAEEIYFDYDFLLYGGGYETLHTHPSGAHSYDFSFNIPSCCPSSFEGEYGYVRYTAQAFLERSTWKADQSRTTSFTVIKHRDLNFESAHHFEPKESETTGIVTCCCVGVGSVHCKFGINKTAFVPGENVIIWAQVSNNSSQTLYFTKVALKQYKHYFGRHTGSIKHQLSSDVVASVVHEGIAAGETYVWDNVPLRIPPLPPTGLEGCNIINVEYVLKFYVEDRHDLKFATDIMIGTVPRANPQYVPITSQPEVLPLPCLPTSAPPPSPTNISPPSYEECVKGKKVICDNNEDSENTQNKQKWAPSYPTYDCQSLAGAKLSPGGATHSQDGATHCPDRATHSPDGATASPLPEINVTAATGLLSETNEENRV